MGAKTSTREPLPKTQVRCQEGSTDLSSQYKLGKRSKGATDSFEANRISRGAPGGKYYVHSPPTRCPWYHSAVRQEHCSRMEASSSFIRCASIRWSAVFVLFAFFASTTAAAAGTFTDREILFLFYVTCNGGNWIDNTNWLDDQVSICEWKGVDCTETGEMVERLRLQNNNVACSLPPFLFLLPELAWLDLRENSGLTADFSSVDAGTVPRLQHLVLSDTDLASVEGISVFADSLATLHLAGCELSGPFPEEILQLTALNNLDLSYNMLSSTIPDGISALADLRTFVLSHNFFSGQMPSTIGNLAKVTNVQLQFNQLTGTLPSELGNLLELTFLSLDNQIQGVGDSRVGGITGPLIDFASIEFLFHLNLSNNNLTGPVPSTILASVSNDLADFMLLDLTSNQLGGELPPELTRFESIRIYLADNKIEGVPAVLCQKSNWLYGSVGEFGCDAILCPPGTFNSFGRQTSISFPCQPCLGLGDAPFFGAQQCEVTTREVVSNTGTIIMVNVTGKPFERMSRGPYFPLLEPEAPNSGSNDNDDWRQENDNEDWRQELGGVSLLELAEVSSSARSVPSLFLLAGLWILVKLSMI